METKREQYIICIGNISDGFDFVGPFEYFEIAFHYAHFAEDQLTHKDWFICKVTNPNEFGK